MGLLAEKRRQYILNNIDSNGRIRVSDIAEQLKVTEVTVRRDLSELQKKGLLTKTYGGAVLAAPPQPSVSARLSESRNLAAKKMIGKLASQLVKYGDIIYLESGSTCYEIIPYLVEHKDLTIIVNSLLLANRLHEYTRHNVIITGGQYRPDRMDMIGPTAEAAIGQLAGFKAFTGADDISIDGGISGADTATVTFAKLVLRQAAQAIFVGDRTKFDNPALYKIANIDRLDYIVTDRPPSENWHNTAIKNNIKLIYPA